ncbi:MULTISPECIES: hypothetical protein [Flavobacterium]|uniref:Uncharacterized protein n=1 Tax=Flavobacterium covae TaxID=2906076 RepID=A0ABW8PJQ6_9FLAO|nr:MULTISPECIES: hypothetical protein [Flavobacterium]MCH4829975.1 hypothetical protein [Flavobacterium columnare]MCH4832645.1 hypothetical protein [Flavobacterium columnare]QYS92118.1 hypothetical protein JJC04_05960 [Flavobacterium covae]
MKNKTKQRITLQADGYITITTKKGIVYPFRKYVLLDQYPNGTIDIIAYPKAPTIISLN